MSPIDIAAESLEHLPRLRPRTRAILDRALEGTPIETDDALFLLDSTDSTEFSTLLAVAGAIRSNIKGAVITYSPKVFIPVTNLCRNRCGYCTFRADPGDPHAWTMSPHEIRSCCAEGKRLGCIEALMCLGDKPERTFRSYRQTLSELGYDSTVDYVHADCEIALGEGLLPHTNAGLLSRSEMERLKTVNVSLGLMLENISARLRGKGEAHFYAPDKDPQKRLAMIQTAGELQIPFTTGILLGIGETHAEVIESLIAIRDMHRAYGHIQEIIIQNFRAKPTTAMATYPEPENLEVAKTIAVARLLAPDMNLQAPPNLSPYDHRLLLRAGINDWGGLSPLTPDFVNPEAPWPHVTALADVCAAEGFFLKARLPVYPEYVAQPGFIDQPLLPALHAYTAHRGVESC